MLDRRRRAPGLIGRVSAQANEKGAVAGALLECPRLNYLTLSDSLFAVLRIAQHIAAAPHGFDVIVAVDRRRQFLAQLADEDVDDLEFGLVHAAIEMIEEHLLGEGGALAERKQLQHLIFLARQVHALAVHFHGFGVEIDGELAGDDHRLAVTLGTAWSYSRRRRNPGP